MKFKIAIEEAVCKEFEVEAKDREAALETARNKYRSGEFVLDPGEAYQVLMSVVSPENEQTDWEEV